MDNQKRATLYALASVLCWSTVASAFKLSLRAMDPAELLVIASLTATLTLFIILWRKGRIRLLASFTRRDYLLSLIMGFLSPFIYYLILFKAYDLLPAQQAQPLNLIWGIIIVILAVPLLKQPIEARTLPAIVISFLGVMVISTRGDLAALHIDNPLGVSLAVGSSLFWSIYWLINTRDQRDPVVRLFVNFCFGSLFILGYVLLLGGFRWPGPGGAAAAVYSGVFEMGLTFYLWLQALKLSDSAAKVSILIYLMPFLSLVFIHLVVGESIHVSSVAGLTLIVAGIILQRVPSLRSGSRPGS